MTFKTNMTGVDEGKSFPLLPMGVYTVEVMLAEESESQAGDPMVKVTLEVTDGEYTGRLAFDRLLFPKPGSKAEKIKGRSMHFLHVIGEPYEGEFEVTCDNWVGKKCSIFVTHREYEGKTYANVRDYDSIDPKDAANKSEQIPF